jgi:hypothetical protein
LAQKRIVAKLKNKAEKRAAALWEFYEANGILYRVDFERLTGAQYASVVETFRTYGLTSPPVYDSRSELYKRKAQSLRDEGQRLGQDFLTIRQAAKVLKVKPSEVVGIEKRLLKAGLELPAIVMDENQGDDQFSESRELVPWGDRINGVCNPLYHPQGLQVLDWREGPGEGQITYLLR